MKDMGNADVILEIKIKRDDKRIISTQSHYIEKMFNRYNYENCTPVKTLFDSSVHLLPNTGEAVAQLDIRMQLGV